MLAWLAFATPAHATFPGFNGKIAFESNAPSPGIHLIDPDGTGEEVLTAGTGDGDPAWSPDGTRIAFTRHADGDGEIFVMNADGTGQAALTSNTVDDSQPAWSPDGAWLGFTRSAGGTSDIYRIAADGSGELNFTQTPTSSESDADWSVGGDIAYTRDGGEIWSSPGPAPGGPETLLVTNGYEGKWSPVGGRLIFARSDGGAPDVWVRNADGVKWNATNTFAPAAETSPAWAPDGSGMVYSANDGDTFDLVAADPDGEFRRDVLRTGEGVDEARPDWQPLPDHTPPPVPANLSASNIGATSEFDGVVTLDWDDSEPGAHYRLYSSQDGINFFRVAGASYLSESTFTDHPYMPGDTGAVAHYKVQALDDANNASALSDPITVRFAYPRPKGATPMFLSLVPAFNSCATPNRTHGAPLSFGSCAPPALASQNLTLGSGGGGAAPAKSIGSLRITAIPGTSPGSYADARFDISLTNVMMVPSLADYTGLLRVQVSVRLTDHELVTVQDFPFKFSVRCNATPDTSIGAACSGTSTLNSIVPGNTGGAIISGRRTILAIDGVRILDGGADGDPATDPNGVLAVAGVFVP